MKTLKKSFKKKEDLFSQTRIRDKTGKNPEVIKRYIPALVELNILRKCDAYYLGCPLDQLIHVNFGFGDLLFCPTCNTEILPSSEDEELVCDCGIHYVKCDTYKWIYQPRVCYSGEGVWVLESFSSPNEFYTVQPFDGVCSCAHHNYRGAYCKHLKKNVEVIANIIFDKVITDKESKDKEELLVITAILKRWFDPRKKNGVLTYREINNELEKNGLKISKNRLVFVVSKLCKNQILDRPRVAMTSVEGKTLFSLNHEVVNRIVALGNQVIEGYTQQFKVRFSEERVPFLKLDGVNNANVMLPNTDFNMVVNVSYNFPKPTNVRLEVLDKTTHIVTCSLNIRLNGEDVTSFNLNPVFGEKVWIPQVDLYYLNGKKEWQLADYYLSGRRVYLPTIRKNASRADVYEVESFSDEGKFYEVDLIDKKCSCPAYTYHHTYCKHLQIVEKINSGLR
ncbi:MAG: SWIM zinc finger family protein [Candidatus Bathyarchaeota archaeon]|nr:SWIM zinc finger family protein [Candidatus Termiticorpusculum sp.]